MSSKKREGCVVTNAIYGGLRICYKKEGDPIDFITLWHIFLTLRRVDEYVQLIVRIDPYVVRYLDPSLVPELW
jgi:hypothetical protein